jgi:hypothetical protein
MSVWLLQTHPEGVEAIETAFDKIIDFKLKERKKVGKITLKPKKVSCDQPPLSLSRPSSPSRKAPKGCGRRHR